MAKLARRKTVRPPNVLQPSRPLRMSSETTFGETAPSLLPIILLPLTHNPPITPMNSFLKTKLPALHVAARFFAVVLAGVLHASGYAADTVTKTPLGQGVYLTHWHYDNLYSSKQEIFAIEVALNTPGISLGFPYLTGGQTQTVSAFAAATPGARGVVNGQFFDASGSIQFLKVNGPIINLTRTTDVHDQQAVSVDGSGVISIIRKPPDGWAGTTLAAVPTIMSSGSDLISEGVSVLFDPADGTYSQRHPRTCAGWTYDNRLYLVVIDGRTTNAAGQTGSEMQTTLQSLGSMRNALNYDGGGSSTMWADGAVVNYPSGGSQRAVANAIAVLAPPYSAHVSAITMSFIRAGAKYKTRATVRVVDAAGVTVNKATVTGDFSGAITEVGVSGVSDTAGNASITSTTAIKTGTVTFTVRNITGSNLSYDSTANVVNAASISR